MGMDLQFQIPGKMRNARDARAATSAVHNKKANFLNAQHGTPAKNLIPTRIIRVDAHAPNL
jgi:hypothetical protein